jgi:sulfonate transport system substrate-binding protein
MKQDRAVPETPPTAFSNDTVFSRLSRRQAGVGLLALMGAGLAACHRQAESALPASVTIASIAYPYQGGQVYNGLTNVVIRDGWLKSELGKRGVGLTFAPVSTAVGGPQINEGFSGKRIDFAAYGDFPAIIATANGVPLKLVVPSGQGMDVYLVAREGVAARSIADLKGKRIALHRGRPWELPFTKLLDSQGLKLTDFTIVNINPSATPAALAAGSVDAAVLLSDGLLAEKNHLGHVIWSTKQAPPEWRMRAELFARGDFVEAHPDITQLVVDAYVRAARWSGDDANRAQVIHDTSRGQVPEDIVTKDYDGATYPWRERFSPGFRPDVASHYHAAADYALSRGLIHAKVDADALLDPRFVAQALKTQRLEGFWAKGAGA